MIKSKIVRDTVMLTAMQLFLDTAALLLNVFISRRLGTSAMGVIALTGTFLVLSGVIAGGNAYLCTSRLISEELGKKDSSPEKVLAYGMRFCLVLSTAASAVIVMFAGAFSERFFNGAEMTDDIRIMPAALISGALAACLKGWFNANRKSSVTAAGDILEFTVRCAVIIFMTAVSGQPDNGTVCGIMIAGVIAGNLTSLIFLAVLYLKNREKKQGSCSVNFGGYISLALPIMGGGVLTAALSSANDALIPICLRQYGDSAGKALSLFGSFEAIVLPAIFFPSVILCSMSGIIVSETARAAAAGNRRRILGLSSKLTEWTLIYAVFASAVLMRFGSRIGELMGGGELAGRMISVIAPVVPFIYMEIVLEAMIKGMGMQAFSSLNYLCEYAVRISTVLILVPRIGFWGIAASYYASNVMGNCLRYAKLVKTVGMEFRPVRNIAVPVLYAFLTMSAAELLVRLLPGSSDTLCKAVIMTLIWGAGYFYVFRMLRRGIKNTKNAIRFVEDAQQNLWRVM